MEEAVKPITKDLIIGHASGYDWDKLKYWIKSIKASGFDGDIAVTATSMDAATIEKLDNEGVEVSLFGQIQPNGDVVAHSTSVPPHVERFFYLWNYLLQKAHNYRYVITTDTRDVIFQENPSPWLEQNLIYESLVSSGEGLQYQHEPWGNENLLQAYGPYFYGMLKEQIIQNVGVIAGDALHVRGLLMHIFQMSVNRPIKICDQASYNFLMAIEPWRQDTLLANHAQAWAVNLGTSIGAVDSGQGQIGVDCANDPKAKEAYKQNYKDEQPLYWNGKVVNQKNVPFVIVHQWDRVPNFKKQMEDMYV